MRNRDLIGSLGKWVHFTKEYTIHERWKGETQCDIDGVLSNWTYDKRFLFYLSFLKYTKV